MKNSSKTNVKSSMLNAVKYENGLLVVYFSNGINYAYQGVSQIVVNEFLAAPSKGKYFRANILNKYNYIRI